MKPTPHCKSLIFRVALPAFLLIAGCDRDKTITAYQSPKEAEVAGDSEMPQGVKDLHWTLPAGWKSVPVPEKMGFRPSAAVQVSDDPDFIMTISELPGSPGARSLAANLARWAGQLQMEPPTDAELPNVVTRAMVGETPVDVISLDNGKGKCILGAIAPHGAATWVFKLSNSSEAVDKQRSAFDQFIHSIRFDAAPAGATPEVAGPSSPGAVAPSSASEDSVSAGAGGAHWTLPAGWTAEPGTTMRLATIHPDGNGPAEIRVSKFGGIAGGAGANVSRWRREVGLDEVDDAHADAGQTRIFPSGAWTIHDYTGPANGGSRLIVASVDHAGETWFFKLLGPAGDVGKIKPDFDRFLASVTLN